MTPEWSRPERLDAIGEREKPVHIEADAAERAGLARRFGLKAVDRLSADLVVRRDAAGVVVVCTPQITTSVPRVRRRWATH